MHPWTQTLSGECLLVSDHRSDCKLLPGLEEGWGLTDTVLFFFEQHALCLRPGQTIPPDSRPLLTATLCLGSSDIWL